ncbi:F18 fimbrial protein FedE [Escherichia coli]|nr:F18 fimbrial protein FedE [Escherichia coli]
MRFTKSALAVAMLMLTADGALADSLASASADVRVEITFIRASCDITVPSSYNLGVLTPGSKEHRDLKITWTCKSDTPIKTALTADVVRGGKDAGNEKVYLVTDGNQATGAALSLKEGNSFIKLTGSQAGDYFCSDKGAVAGVTERTCTLTPVTNVSQNGPFGLASATLRFEVGYP